MLEKFFYSNNKLLGQLVTVTGTSKFLTSVTKKDKKFNSHSHTLKAHGLLRIFV